LIDNYTAYAPADLSAGLYVQIAADLANPDSRSLGVRWRVPWRTHEGVCSGSERPCSRPLPAPAIALAPDNPDAMLRSYPALGI
jgi:hypothetical protein